MNTVAVIPAYNEAQKIGGVIADVRPYVECIVVVDDGSSDDTAAVARAAGALVIRHAQNCGAGAAPMTGFEAARTLNADAVVTLDADGQMPVEDIPALLAPIQSGSADIAFGNRFCGRNRIPFIRRCFNQIGNLVTFIATGLWVPDSQSGFKAFNRKVLSEIDLQLTGFEYCSEIVRETVQNRWRAVHVPVKVIYSPYTMAKGQSLSNGIITALKILLRSFLR